MTAPFLGGLCSASRSFFLHRFRRLCRIDLGGRGGAGRYQYRLPKVFFSFCVGGVAAATVTCGTTIVLCRPLDTPGYLIPYYLRDVRSRFNHYASHRKSAGGPKYMTVEDFVRAVLASRDPTESIGEYAVEELRRLFVELDSNGDMYLSQREFAFMMLLLSTRPEQLQLLFNLLDEGRRGSLTLEQFTRVLCGIGCDPLEAAAMTRRGRGGLVKKLFGPQGAAHCTYSQLAKTIDAIHVAIWKAEFRQFDTDRNDRITAEQFGRLIANQMLGSHIPFYIVDNMRRMRGSGDTMTLDHWISFHRLMQNADTIQESMELYTAAGLPVRREDLNRVVKAAGMSGFSEVELDLVMALFDRNNDGILQYDEFFSVIKDMMSYHVRSVPSARKHMPVRFVECVGEAIRDSGKK